MRVRHCLVLVLLACTAGMRPVHRRGNPDYEFHPGDADHERRELSEGFYSDVDETVVSVGRTHSCAVDEGKGDGDFGGRVKCWGSNSFGQLDAPQVRFIRSEQLLLGNGGERRHFRAHRSSGLSAPMHYLQPI